MSAMRPVRLVVLAFCLLSGCAIAPRVPVVPPPPHEQPGAPAGIAIIALPWSHPGTPAGSQVAPGSVAGAVALTGAAGAASGVAAAAAAGAPLGAAAAAAGPAALAMLAFMGAGAAWLSLMASAARDMAAQVGRDAGLTAVEAAAHESIGPVLEEHIGIVGATHAKLIRDHAGAPYDPAFARALRERGYGALIVIHGPKLDFFTFAGPDAVYFLDARAHARLVDTANGRVVAARNVFVQRWPRSPAAWTQDDGRTVRAEAEAATRTLAGRIADTFVLQAFNAAPPNRNPPSCGVEHREPKSERGFGGLVIPRVDSLTPRLAWDPVPRAPESGAAVAGATDVRYDLRVWRIRETYVDELVFERVGLTEPAHRVEAPLAPATTYGWSVRTRYRIEGRPRTGQWSQAEAYRGPTRPDFYAYVVSDGGAAQEVPCVHEGLLSCGCMDFARGAFLWRFTTP